MCDTETWSEYLEDTFATSTPTYVDGAVNRLNWVSFRGLLLLQVFHSNVQILIMNEVSDVH